MASWTAPKTWSAAAQLTAAELDTHVRDNETWLKDALTTSGITSDSVISKIKSALYGVKASRTSNQSIADATDTSILFNAADIFDSDAFHDTVTNNARLTVPTGGGGYYLLSAHAAWDTSVAGFIQIEIELNGTGGVGTTVPGSVTRISPGNSVTHEIGTPATLALLSAADYVACTVRQSSGGALNVTGASFMAVRLFAT